MKKINIKNRAGKIETPFNESTYNDCDFCNVANVRDLSMCIKCLRDKRE